MKLILHFTNRLALHYHLICFVNTWKKRSVINKDPVSAIQQREELRSRDKTVMKQHMKVQAKRKITE